MPLAPGHKLASYEILSAIGSGGMGDVYRARDARLGRDVALKVLPPDVVNEPGRLERFDREARAIAALNHPHIVTIYSTEQADGIRFLTMELVEGHTLSDLVVPSGIAIGKFLEIAMPIGRCARGGAPEADHASRPEAGQRDDLQRRAREGARLRAGARWPAAMRANRR